MNPSDANSHLATLRQLKEMLDAGTLTPQEFEALKQQLVFGSAAPTTPPSPEVTPATPETSVLQAPLVEDSPSPEVASTASYPDWLATPTTLPVESTAPTTYPDEVKERRNPLTLVFAIGGALLLLSIILYLVLGRPTSADEHLTSTSQTAADSAAIAPEVGPQAQQITLAPTAPETIRVDPATPPPAATVPAGFRTDSAAAPAPSAPSASSAPLAPSPVTPPATPSKAPVPTKATPTPAASLDSSAIKTGQH